jgi:hypothetical protein
MHKLTIAMLTEIPLDPPNLLRALRRRVPMLASAAIAVVLSAMPLLAQHVGVMSLSTLTGETEERARLGQLLGETNPGGFTLRSPSKLTPDRASWTVGIIAPEVRVIGNSALPYSINEGSLWAGRGWSREVTAGFFIQTDRLRLIIAPTVVSEQNRAFQVIPYPQGLSAPPSTPPRSVWANPFHPLPESIDLPIRFGDQSRRQLDAGQSSLALRFPLVAVGIANQNRWWGPGIRNALTLSSNAPGFPHAFVETPRPVPTRFGTFDVQWIVGRLTESDFFDLDSTNNSRSLSGLAATWSPRGDSGLSIGIARLVMARQSNEAIPIGAAFDILRSVGQPNTDMAKSPAALRRDQITSLFARWAFPGAGFETYAEWARFEEPASLRDLLEFPGHSEGYTVGLQWARKLAGRTAFQLQTEASYLEPDPSLRVRPVATTYTSRAVPQGFTQRGRTLGAAIGPGGSSQWLAADVFAAHWRLGPYLGRIRWDNGTLFEPIVPQFKRQDVSLLAGVRGSAAWQGVRLNVDFAHAARFDYLFQTYVLPTGKTGGIDIANNTLAVTLTTAVP